MRLFVLAASIALLAALSLAVTGVEASPANISGAVALNAQTACKAGSVSAVIGGSQVCLRVGGKCKARYKRAYEKKGFRCVAGRLRKKPTKQPPPLPPPPPPPPAALEGRYVFTTSQSNAGTVNILPGGHSLSNFVIPYSAPCSDGSRAVSVLSTRKDLAVPLDANLIFASTAQITDSNGTWNIDVRAQFDTAGSVSGSLAVTINRTTGATCSTGWITFSGKMQPTG